MTTEFLFSINEVAIFVVLAAILAIAMELAFCFGKRCSDRIDDKSRSQIGAVSGTLIGFMALLLGFTFSMALSRYNDRKDILQRETNDLGTAFLRSDILLEPYSTNSKQLMLEYAEHRFAKYYHDITRQESEDLTAKVDAIQDALWKECMIAVRDPNILPAPITACYVNTLSNLISDRGERTFALNNHVPEPIIWIMLIIAMIAVGLCGFANGLHKMRNPIIRIVLILCVVVTLVMIIDLDRPRRGLITIDQSPMGELVEQFRDVLK